MRSVVSISLLMLLFYHTGRVWVVLACFENSFPTASPVMGGDEWMTVRTPISLPYASAWQDREAREGLVRVKDQFYNVTQQRYENDTLYTVLKTNLGAREHFFALADEIKQAMDRQVSHRDAQKSPLGQLLKSLNQWAKVYLPFSMGDALKARIFTIIKASQNSFLSSFSPAIYRLVLTPPPR